MKAAILFVTACVASSGGGRDVYGELRASYGGVEWRQGQRMTAADVTYDGIEDVVIVARDNTQVVIGIVDGANEARVWTLAFPQDRALQRAVCSVRAVQVVYEDPDIDLGECTDDDDSEYCRNAIRTRDVLRREGAEGGRGIRVDDKECDAIHLFFDGTRFQWWRR